MGLIGKHDGMWEALQHYIITSNKPTWGTCAGMILLAERCIGTSAVIENGQSLIGGMDVLVCRNYFGSQISSFEMLTPPPPGMEDSGKYSGVFIRAPAILSVGDNVQVLGKVVATPCRQAAVVLNELEHKIEAGENVIMMGVVDALERSSDHGGIKYKEVKRECNNNNNNTATATVDENSNQEEKKDVGVVEMDKIELPGASDVTNAREVISAARTNNILITAFHPELTEDLRWHSYFYNMVKESVLQNNMSKEGN